MNTKSYIDMLKPCQLDDACILGLTVDIIRINFHSHFVIYWGTVQCSRCKALRTVTIQYAYQSLKCNWYEIHTTTNRTRYHGCNWDIAISLPYDFISSKTFILYITWLNDDKVYSCNWNTASLIENVAVFFLSSWVTWISLCDTFYRWIRKSDPDNNC